MLWSKSGGEPSHLDAETSDEGSQSDQNGSEADTTVTGEAADGGDATVQDAGSDADITDDQNEQIRDAQVKQSGTSDEDRAE